MSRNTKPDNIVEAFLYIAKRCLTPNEQNDLSEKLRDPRLVHNAPTAVTASEPQQQSSNRRPRQNTYENNRYPAADNVRVRDDYVPQGSGGYRGGERRSRGGNTGYRSNNVTDQSGGRGSMAVSAGYESTQPKVTRNNRRPQPSDPENVMPPQNQGRSRGRGRGRGRWNNRHDS